MIQEFKLNPNAKSFTPLSSMRLHTAVSDGSIYYPSNATAVPHMHGLPIGVGVSSWFFFSVFPFVYCALIFYKSVLCRLCDWPLLNFFPFYESFSCYVVIIFVISFLPMKLRIMRIWYCLSKFLSFSSLFNWLECHLVHACVESLHVIFRMWFKLC